MTQPLCDGDVKFLDRNQGVQARDGWPLVVDCAASVYFAVFDLRTPWVVLPIVSCRHDIYMAENTNQFITRTEIRVGCVTIKHFGGESITLGDVKDIVQSFTGFLAVRRSRRRLAFN